jgi:hypothetical protein
MPPVLTVDASELKQTGKVRAIVLDAVGTEIDVRAALNNFARMLTGQASRPRRRRSTRRIRR